MLRFIKCILLNEQAESAILLKIKYLQIYLYISLNEWKMNATNKH